ncbi:MAG: tRNA 2-thiocytidine biosynthesis TtcA family protein [candidate division WOR-3 bacterium]|nr:tRNA 2-thiocytidine biosynthesis TtcA family protein [candidate division WOR-3 bacterium]
MANGWLNKKCFHFLNKAISQYQLLTDNEKILIAVSGGVDSLVLTHLLHTYNQRKHKNWQLLAVHIHPGFANWDTKKLVRFFEAIKIKYLISKIDVEKKFAQVQQTGRVKKCFFCSRERRRRLFEIADKNEIKKIALAHHLEDVNETYFLNLFYASETTTFVPKQDFFQGKFFIVRPLYFFDKELIYKYAQYYQLPKINNKCPYEKESNRMLIRKFLNQLYKRDPRIKTNIFWGIKNIKYQYLP